MHRTLIINECFRGSLTSHFKAVSVRIPACEQVVGLPRRHTYSTRRQNSAADRVHTASSTHGTSSRRTPTTLPSRLSTAATSVAPRRRPRLGSAGAEQGTQLVSRSPHDSWHRDAPREDRYDESMDNMNTDILHKHRYATNHRLYEDCYNASLVNTDTLHTHVFYAMTNTPRMAFNQSKPSTNGYTYTVSQKKDTNAAHYSFDGDQPILIIFGRDVAERVCYEMVICYPTSHN